MPLAIITITPKPGREACCLEGMRGFAPSRPAGLRASYIVRPEGGGPIRRVSVWESREAQAAAMKAMEGNPRFQEVGAAMETVTVEWFEILQEWRAGGGGAGGKRGRRGGRGR